MAHRKALVLGATGGIGGEVARRLKANGWEIVALHRDAAKRAGADGFAWRQGDAMAAAEVMAAAEGASLIVHAVNPPGYRDWGKLVLPMLDNTIAAARAAGARVLLPGTVYNYGPDAFPAIDEAAPQTPVTVKGRIRAEMERRLREAAASGVRTLIVRAGDFFGPRAGNNWFAQGLEAGQATHRDHLSRQAGHRPSMGLSAGRGGNHGAARRERRGTRAVRHFPHGGPLGRGRHADDRRHPPSVRPARPAGPPFSVGFADACLTLRAPVPGAAGDALSLAGSHPADERASRRHAGRRTANAAGIGRRGNARGSGLPGTGESAAAARRAGMMTGATMENRRLAAKRKNSLSYLLER